MGPAGGDVYWIAENGSADSVNTNSQAVSPRRAPRAYPDWPRGIYDL